jgi:hypothetical protein
VDEDDRVVGVITETDVFKTFIEHTVGKWDGVVVGRGQIGDLQRAVGVIFGLEGETENA